MSNKPTVQYIEINSAETNRRIDNFLLTKLKGVPKSHLYQLMRKGEIRVNKKRIKPTYRLQKGDIVRIAPIRTSQKCKTNQPNQHLTERLQSTILFEDDNLLILNKPIGLAVHAGSGLSFGVIEILRHMRPNEPFLELAHRLDRHTSGCLIIAKKRNILNELHEMLKQGRITKIYYALTQGHWAKKVNRVTVPLKKNIKISGERIVKASNEGKSALTEFVVVERYQLGSLVEAKLHTGRTHQIRVHAQFSGHPIAGDDKYGDKTFNRIMRQKGLKRMFLHAWKIQLKLIGMQKPLIIEAPLDDELREFLAKLD